MRDDLVAAFRGADAVVHLAWLIQPSRDRATTRSVNVDGSRRVFEAAAAAGVPTLVYASSVGAYSPGPKDRRVDESWPTGGIPTSFYSRDKSDVEAILDGFEAAHPDMRVVRLRPGLIFKGEAASGIRRLFAGPLLPTPLLRRRLIPIVPALERLRFQGVHSFDVGEAYHLAITRDVRGAFNVAAEPVLDPPELARLLEARPVPRARARAARGGRRLVEAAPAADAAGLAGPRARRSADGHDPRARGARLDARRAPPARRCSSSSTRCAAARASTPRRCRPAAPARCACASS